MRIPLRPWSLVLVGLAVSGAQDPAKEKLRQALKDEVHGDWFYDDIPAGFARARETGRPLLVAFR